MSYVASTYPRSAAQERSLFQQVYQWMALGLGLTGIVALWTYSSGTLERILSSAPGIMLGLIVVELGLVLGLSWAIGRISAAVATGAFVLYAAVNGLTLATIFLTYTAGSIASTFFIAGGTFALMSVYGYTTKRDLTRWGSLLIMALVGLIIASIVNLFLRSEALYWVVSYAGVLIFVGLIAYDTQKIKRLSDNLRGAEVESVQKYAILGALTLYLDFVNLFLFLLRILGKRR